MIEEPTPQREEAIVQMVADQKYSPIRWCAIRSKVQEDSAILLCASDALLLPIGPSESYVRVNVTHTGAQRIADLLGLRLPTTKISDLVHLDTLHPISPCAMTPDRKMAHTSRMIRHSTAIDLKLLSREATLLTSTVGKDWVLTKRLEKAPERGANYGWHTSVSRFKGPGGLAVLQPLGLAHDRFHVDYSQVLRLIHPEVIVNGDKWQLDDLLTHPTLHKLVSDEGPFNITRHPGVDISKAVTSPPLACF